MAIASSRASTPTPRAAMPSAPLSARWSFAASGSYLRTQDPVTSGGTTSRTFFLADVAATWHWTEVWTITLEAKRQSTQYEVPQVSPTAITVSLELAKQFPRIDL